MNQHRSYQFAYHDWGLYLSKLVGLSDCFLSLIIGSAHSLLSFTVRSSTTIVTSWEDNLEQAWSLGQLLSDSYSLLQREISLPLLIYGLIRSTHYMDQSGLLIIFYRDFEYSLLVFTIFVCYLARFTLLLIVGQMVSSPSSTSLVLTFLLALYGQYVASNGDTTLLLCISLLGNY